MTQTVIESPPVMTAAAYCHRCGTKLRSTNIDPHTWMGKPVCDPCHHAIEAQKERKLYDRWEDIPDKPRKRNDVVNPGGPPGVAPHVADETYRVLAMEEPITAKRLAYIMGLSYGAMKERLQLLRREGKAECLAGYGGQRDQMFKWQTKED